MRYLVVVMPHEREDAIEAYGSKLTAEQIQEIRDCPEEHEISIEFDEGVAELKFKDKAAENIKSEHKI